MEQLLAIDPIGADRGLAFGRSEPVGKTAGGLLLGVGVLLRIEQNHIVAVQQSRIAFDQHGDVAFVAEAEPAATIG